MPKFSFVDHPILKLWLNIEKVYPIIRWYRHIDIINFLKIAQLFLFTLDMNFIKCKFCNNFIKVNSLYTQIFFSDV